MRYFSIHLRIYFILTFILLPIIITAQPNGEGLVVGKKYRIQSNVLKEERIIYVYLPPGYRYSKQKYPVAYLLDGYEHFHYTSGIIKALAGSNKIPQMIIIGILNVDRYRDFTPYEVDYFPTSGGAHKFTRFLSDELFPFVQRYYRIAKHRILIGHSLTGLFAVNTLIENNSLFNGYIAASPALLHVDSVITTDYPGKLKELQAINKSIYFTIGGKESEATINCAENLRDAFNNAAPEGIKWQFDFMENDNHTSLIFNSIYNGLLMIYSSWEIPLERANEGIETLKEYYNDLSAQLEYEIPITSSLISSVGRRLINQKMYDGAINLLEQGINIFPEAARLQNNLGVAYEQNGQLELAKESYDSACDKAAKCRDPYYILFVENLNNISSILNNKEYKKVFEAQLL